jgi:hypothetical protein
MNRWKVLAVLTVMASLTGACKSTTTAQPAQPPARVPLTATSTSAPQSATPSPTRPALTLKAKGCALISRQEAETAAGTTLGAGKSDSYKLTTTIVAHSGCGFNSGDRAVGFDINTLAKTIPVAQYEQSAMAVILSHGGKSVTVDGHKGVEITIGPVQDVAFYVGQQGVIVTAANVKAGAALAVGTLLGNRI